MATKWIKISDTLAIRSNYIVSVERFTRTFTKSDLPTSYGLRIKVQHEEEEELFYYEKEEERDRIYSEILNN